MDACQAAAALPAATPPAVKPAPASTMGAASTAAPPVTTAAEPMAALVRQSIGESGSRSYKHLLDIL